MDASEAELQQLERYRPLQVIGKGNYGKAVLVEDRQEGGGRKVLKCVQLARLSSRAASQAHNETVILGQLTHVNIIQHYHSFMVGQRLCIVTEYAEEGDLRNAIQNKKACGELFCERDIATIFFQICEALSYLHARSIVHRDLKSDNIFLKNGLQVKLGDFGIAKELTSPTTNTAIGTPFYLSPEICRQQPYDSKTDMWSLGCVLYELITLEHAFSATTFSDLCARIIAGQYKQIQRPCHPFLLTLISRLFEKDPSLRPSALEILKWRSEVLITTPSAQDECKIHWSNKREIRTKILALFKKITLAQQPNSQAQTSKAQLVLWVLALRVQLERLLGMDLFEALLERARKFKTQDCGGSDALRIYCGIIWQLSEWENSLACSSSKETKETTLFHPLTLEDFLNYL